MAPLGCVVSQSNSLFGRRMLDSLRVGVEKGDECSLESFYK